MGAETLRRPATIPLVTDEQPTKAEETKPMTLTAKLMAWANLPAVALVGLLLYQAQAAGLQQLRDQQTMYREELRFQRQHDEDGNRALGVKLDRLIDLNQQLLSEVKKITDIGDIPDPWEKP